MDYQPKTSYFASKGEFISSILPSITPNGFITMKHDPNYSHGKNSEGKSVFSLNMSGSIASYLSEGNYEITEYENIRYPNSPFIVISPREDDTLTGYYINSGSSFDKHNTDNYERNNCIVIVSGSNIGWHGYTENKSNIGNFEKQEKLKLINKLM